MEILRHLPREFAKKSSLIASAMSLLLLAPGPVGAGGETSSHFQGNFGGLRVFASARCGETMRLGIGEDYSTLENPVSMLILGSELPDVPMVLGIKTVFPSIAERRTLILYAGSSADAFVILEGTVWGVSAVVGIAGFEDGEVLQGSSQGFGPTYQVFALPATRLELGQPVQIGEEPLAESSPFQLICP